MITELNRNFSITDNLKFITESHGLNIIYIANDFATAQISLHGAQVLSFRPREEDDLLWVSKKSLFEQDKAIRGGIPLCCPWFGAHPSDSTQPSHGFARLSEWRVISTKKMHNGATRISFELTPSNKTKKYWDNNFVFTLTVTVHKKLTIELNIQNCGDKPITITAALHTYFNISDINNVTIYGLEDSPFIGIPESEENPENKPITINQELDRIYLDHNNDCTITDTGLNRTIRIAKQGSNSTVIWNPWIDKAKRMLDFGDTEYKTMLCVETTNADNDAREILPSLSHTLATTISLDY